MSFLHRYAFLITDGLFPSPASQFNEISNCDGIKFALASGLEEIVASAITQLLQVKNLTHQATGYELIDKQKSWKLCLEITTPFFNGSYLS
jgi:hypothetical protein